MSKLFMPHPDELIDHEAECLDFTIRRGRAREPDLR